jgi:Sulfotransferase domain
VDWYEAHFRGSDAVQFEATPRYLYYPQVPQRIFAYRPDMRLIALLRDPVERAWSAWNMFRSLCADRPEYIRALLPDCDPPTRASFEEMLAADPFPTFETSVTNEIAAITAGAATRDPGYVQRGLYERQLRGYLEYFERDQLLVIESTRLRDDTRACLAEVVEFLELPPYSWSNEALPRVAEGSYEGAPPEAIGDLLRDFFEPHNRRLYALLGVDFAW